MNEQDEQEALAWLRETIDRRRGVDDCGSGDYRLVVERGYLRAVQGVIDRLLARPVLPEPFRELAETLRAMHDENADYSFINKLGGYDNHNMRRARAILTKMGVGFDPDREKPATKAIERWRIEFACRSPNGWKPNSHEVDTQGYAEEWAERYRLAGHACIRVTGPHQQEVPNV